MLLAFSFLGNYMQELYLHQLTFFSPFFFFLERRRLRNMLNSINNMTVERMCIYVEKNLV